MAKKQFWKPYATDIKENVTVWNHENVLMKADSVSCLPYFLTRSFEKGATHPDYKVTASCEGKAKTVFRKKTRAEFDALKVVSDVNKSGIYDLELVKKVRKPGSEMYLSDGSGILLIVNKDGSCGLVAHCVVDVFEEAV